MVQYYCAICFISSACVCSPKHIYKFDLQYPFTPFLFIKIFGLAIKEKNLHFYDFKII